MISIKKILLIIVTLFIFISVDALDLNLNSKYVYVHNLTEDRTMYELNSNEEIKVASMTKIMTAIIIIENNKNLDKKVTIKDEDLRDMYEYATVGFQEGYEVTIKEILYGILLRSGSDAVNAGVRVTTDTEEEFVNLMNNKVKELGLTHTHFSNPVGKDKDNYSSAHDIGKIMEYCLKNETFKDIISTSMYYIDRLDLQINGPLYKMNSKYNIDLSNIKGGKNGYTGLAKYSLVSYGEKNNITYIVVTDYVDNYKNLLLDNIKIYDYFLNNYDYIDYNVNFDLNIENGKNEKYKIDLNTKIYLSKKYDKELINYKYDGKNKITIQDKKGSKIGTVSIYYDKELIKQVDVIIDKDIEYKSNINIFMICEIIIVLIIVMVILSKITKKSKKKEKNSIEKIKVIEETKKNANKTNEAIEKFVALENSREKKLKILENTIDINLFFDTLKNTDNIDKSSLEHVFIDRCFENIDFKNIEDLRDLYTKLKLYKNEMNEETIKYSNKLFKYCIENYVNKTKKG